MEILCKFSCFQYKFSQRCDRLSGWEDWSHWAGRSGLLRVLQLGGRRRGRRGDGDWAISASNWARAGAVHGGSGEELSHLRHEDNWENLDTSRSDPEIFWGDTQRTDYIHQSDKFKYHDSQHNNNKHVNNINNHQYYNYYNHHHHHYNDDHDYNHIYDHNHIYNHHVDDDPAAAMRCKGRSGAG